MEIVNFSAVNGETTRVLTFSGTLTILSIWTQNLGLKFQQADSQTPADLLGAIGFRVKSILCNQQHFFQIDPQVGLHLLQPQHFIPLQVFVLSQELQIETKINGQFSLQKLICTILITQIQPKAVFVLFWVCFFFPIQPIHISHHC